MAFMQFELGDVSRAFQNIYKCVPLRWPYILYVDWIGMGCCLNKTYIKLELLTDSDMLMIEKGILEGVSMILNYFEGKIIHILVITTIQAIQQNTSLILM